MVLFGSDVSIFVCLFGLCGLYIHQNGLWQPLTIHSAELSLCFLSGSIRFMKLGVLMFDAQMFRDMVSSW